MNLNRFPAHRFYVSSFMGGVYFFPSLFHLFGLKICVHLNVNCIYFFASLVSLVDFVSNKHIHIESEKKTHNHMLEQKNSNIGRQRLLVTRAARDKGKKVILPPIPKIHGQPTICAFVKKSSKCDFPMVRCTTVANWWLAEKSGAACAQRICIRNHLVWNA